MKKNERVTNYKLLQEGEKDIKGNERGILVTIGSYLNSLMVEEWQHPNVILETLHVCFDHVMYRIFYD